MPVLTVNVTVFSVVLSQKYRFSTGIIRSSCNLALIGKTIVDLSVGLVSGLYSPFLKVDSHAPKFESDGTSLRLEKSITSLSFGDN